MEEELREWRSFLAIADHGGFSRAAAALGINQPNLSRHIAALERRLGFQLFDRIARGVSLTAPGAELIGPARDLLARLDGLHAQARKISGGESGILRLGASSQTLVSFVAPLVGGFCRQHPSVDVRLGEGPADEIVAAVESGRLEFGIVGASVSTPLNSIPLYAADIQLFVPARDAAVYRARADVRALDRMPLLVPSRASLTRRLLDAACLECGVAPELRLESESAEALVALVEEGYGTAVLPSTVVLRTRRIRRVALYAKGRKLSTTMNLVWNADLYHSRAAVLLFEEIKRFAREKTSPG